MAANNQKNTRILLFLLLCIRMTLTVDANDFLFTSINTAQGLSDNQIRYILQLPDGRMVFTTNGNVNLYDGVHFSYLHRTAEDISPLKQYEGCYRIYQCGDSLLWIKDYHKLMCIDLHQEKYIPHLDSYFRGKRDTRTGRRPFRRQFGTYLATYFSGVAGSGNGHPPHPAGE